MAGDWIKMETELHEKPEVFAISTALKMNRFEVVGRLHRVWSWYNKHTESGHAASVTNVTVDEVAGRDGFAQAMISAGWGEEADGVFTLPKFDRHNGNTAKSRALAAQRQGKSRAKRDKSHADTVTKTQPEKRREDNIEINQERGSRRPTIEQAKAAAASDGIDDEIAVQWWHAREASDWMRTSNGATMPVGSWRSDLKSYSLTIAQSKADRRPKHRQGEFSEPALNSKPLPRL
jgi:hypothetical protein